MPFDLIDRTYRQEPRHGLTLAAAGEALLNIACARWVVRRDPQRSRPQGEEGRLLAPFLLAVVPHGGTLVTVARTYARTRNAATKKLTEAAAGYDWRGTRAEHWQVAEAQPPARPFARDAKSV